MIYVASLDFNQDAVIGGAQCVTSINELYRALVQKDTSEIHIERGFADHYFTPSGLADFVENATSINPYCTVTVDAEVKDFHMDAIKKLSRYTSVDDIIYQLMANPKEMLETLKILCDAYNGTYTETLQANNKVATLQLQVSQLQRELEEKQNAIDSTLRAKTLVEEQLGMLVGRINNSYSKDVDPSQFIQIEGKSRYTKILYIKERTRVRYVDTLIYYIKELLRTLYGVPVRLCVIGPYYAYEGLKMYPSCMPSFNLTYSELYKDDIYMPGFQPKVMEDILRNPSHVEFLIILDRGGLDHCHVMGEGVEYIYTMSDPADNYDSIPATRVISYFHDTLYIPFIENWDDLGAEAKLSRYSSMHITKALIELLEKR